MSEVALDWGGRGAVHTAPLLGIWTPPSTVGASVDAGVGAGTGVGVGVGVSVDASVVGSGGTDMGA
eukprot:365399-Chlamydomonas_euryale.AAC.8